MMKHLQYAVFPTHEKAEEASEKYGTKHGYRGATHISILPLLDGAFALPLYKGLEGSDWSHLFEGTPKALAPEEFWDPLEYLEKKASEAEYTDG